MSRQEIIEILNELKTLYPRMFADLSTPQTVDRYVKMYTKYLYGLTFDDVQKGIDRYVLSDNGKYPPGINELVTNAKREQTNRRRKEGKGTRRIVTEDETMYGYYLEEMAKPPEKRNEWLIRQCLPSCKIMTDPEAYKAKYGKYREEYEPY